MAEGGNKKQLKTLLTSTPDDLKKALENLRTTVGSTSSWLSNPESLSKALAESRLSSFDFSSLASAFTEDPLRTQLQKEVQALQGQILDLRRRSDEQAQALVREKSSAEKY